VEPHEEPTPPERAPAPPAEARVVFGDRLALAARYADHLASTGVSHGLVGPREVPRLWERHLLNCAVLGELVPEGGEVIDVGAGAGLPGIPVALCRPDLSVTLVEPLLRRVAWLETVVADLELSQVRVRRARAEELTGELAARYVTARAVAPLDRLVRWSAPLLVPGGELLAIKGRRALEELAEHGELLRRWGISGEVVRAGESVLEEPTVVVRLTVPDPELVLGRRRAAAARRGQSRRRRPTGGAG
jgi:16S rRNA (guanine527-N7)-methyltransferase